MGLSVKHGKTIVHYDESVKDMSWTEFKKFCLAQFWINDYPVEEQEQALKAEYTEVTGKIVKEFAKPDKKEKEIKEVGE